MVILWCRQIIDGNRTYQQVPTKIQELVRDKLIELGYVNLIS